MDQLISNSNRTPLMEEISSSMEAPGGELWDDLNQFIQERFHASPKVQYSTCSGKRGWNVKYKKSGKALVTLYPERSCYTALVVISLELASHLKESGTRLHPLIAGMLGKTKPYLGGLWLMIPVADKEIEDYLKNLLILKSEYKK